MPEALSWAQLLDSAEEVSNTTYEPLPEGNYDFTVVSGEERTASNGKAILSFRIQVISEEKKGRTAFINQVISPESPKSMGIFFNMLKGLGIDVKWLAKENPTNAQVISNTIGATFKGNVRHRQYEGKTQVDIWVDENIAPGGRAPGVPSGLPAGGPVLPAPVPAATPVAATTPAAPTAPATPAAPAAPALPPTTGNPFRV